MKGLNDMEVDALKEVGNVGVGNAATALSKLLNKVISIDLPETKLVPLGSFADEFGGAERMVVSLYLHIEGDLRGECIFIFPDSGALELVDLTIGQACGTTTVMGEFEESAFREVSNIFTGAYLSSLATMLDMRLVPSVPFVASDMAQSVIDFVLIQLSRSAESILCVKTAIDIAGHNINGQFIMLFEKESQERMLARLKEKFGLE